MKKTKRNLMAIPFAVMTTMMLATSVFASETEVQVEKVAVNTETVSINVAANEAINAPLMNFMAEQMLAEQLQKENSQDITSTNDEKRRAALEQKYDIQLESYDKWNNNGGSNYTSINKLKQSGFYAENANRQELILYGVRTDDWQPYRAYQAERSPAHFEIVDGKYEYSKVYWGQYIQSSLAGYNGQLAKYFSDAEKSKEIKEERKAFVEKYAKIFNDAPGVIPYVVHFNHTEEIAKENGVSTVEKGYFDSKYNHPDVLTKGIFKTESTIDNAK